MTTLGIDNQFQCVQLSDGSIIKLRVLDTAGQEKFNALSERYYKEADCCLLMYDITSTMSFEKVRDYYIEQIKGNCKSDIKVILLGNKTDLKNQRQVSDVDGKDLAEENGYMFMESSCKDNYNVSDAFTTIVEMTNNDIKKGIKIIDTNKGDKLKKSQNKNRKCC